MDVNFTFFIQLIHFGCAYYLLRRFFFAPLVAHIQSQDDILRELSDSVQARTVLIGQKERALYQKWDEHVGDFSRCIPPLVSADERIFKNLVGPMKVSAFTDKELRILHDGVVATLVKRIECVD